MPWSNQKDFKKQDSSASNLKNGKTDRFSDYRGNFKKRVKDPEFKKKMQQYREYVKQSSKEEENGYGEGDGVLPDTFFSLIKDTKDLIKHNVKNKIKQRRENSKEKKEREEREEKQAQSKPQGVQAGGQVNATTSPEGGTPPVSPQTSQ